MGAKIHLYPLERFQFGDDDYYDIDYFDGQIYTTAKIKGSTIKAGIQTDTIYTADGTINGDRNITGDNQSQLLFDLFRKVVFNTNPAPFGTAGFEINSEPTGVFLSVKNASTGIRMLQVDTAGVRINQEYRLPLVDGAAGQAIQTDGSGILSWYTPATGDMLKSQYDPNDDGIVESARKEMVAFINKTGATLTKGTIVYLKSTSASATFPEVLKANASTEATSSKTIGAVYEDVANDDTGFIITSGEADNLDTTAYSIGQKLWLSTIDGEVTPIPPTQPNHTVFIGTVTRSQNVNGRILYAIQNGYELDELHNVLISAPVDGQFLSYDSVSGLWKNVSPSSPAQIELPPVINVLNTPPVSPNDGDRYRIGTAPTGAWSGNANKIAEYDLASTSWIYTTPVTDNLVFQTATSTTFRFNGTGWIQWAGSPILQNGNTFGGVARIGTNDNFNVILKRNNSDTFSVGATLFSQRNAGGSFGTFNLGAVTAFQNWDLPNASGTIALTSDVKQSLAPSEIRRGVIPVSGATTIIAFGGVSSTPTGSVFALAYGGTVPLPKVRFYTINGTTDMQVGMICGTAGAVHRIGKGFRFIGSWIYSDQSTGGTNWYVPGARQFCGLATGLALLPISSANTLESRTNIIGLGSDATDTNLHIFHNDSAGTCTKINLGVNFPANKTAAVAQNEAYQLELFSEFGSISVKYTVRRLSDGLQVTGTITTNLPTGVDLGPQIVRTSGSSSQNISIDLIQLTAYTRE